MKKQTPPRGLAVIDFETDPFKHGRIPEPFVAGFYESGQYREFWGDDCVQQLVDYLLHDRPDPLLIYAHNGGKFDFFFMLQHLENPLKVINGRITSSHLGPHELRDSYAIIPVSLATHDKGEIDYALFEREKRDEHRSEISKYLRRDCESLHQLVLEFLNRFGLNLTVGGTAIKELAKMHPFEKQRSGHDKTFRPFYFGGRCEAFERGILRDDWHVFDVNSMYPHVMSEFDHPTGSGYVTQYGGILDKRGRISGIHSWPMYFAHIECHQSGAFPTRRNNAPLDFNVAHGEFWVTSHELRAAMDTGRVSGVKVIRCFAPRQVIRFREYVELWMAEKIRSKKAGDRIGEIFAKLMLNSAYGKFGQSPDNYFSFHIQRPDDDLPEDDELEIYMVHDSGARIWRKPAPARSYFDVATAASITSAARSVLMCALARADRPVYCDTDSIICRALDVEQDASRLGAWKLEARGSEIAVAGKKLYALKDDTGKIVKKAHKGALIGGAAIYELARGGSVTWESESPTFSMARGVGFIARKLGDKKALAPGTKKR